MKKKDLALDLLDMALAQRDEPVALATALIALDKLAQQRPSHGPTHYASGRVLMLLGKYQLALGAFRVCLLHAPEHYESLYFEGVCQWMLGYDEEALACFSRARAAEPTRMEAYYDAGQIHSRRGEMVRALELFDWARDLEPEDFNCVKKLLQCQISLGHWEEARQTRTELFTLREVNPNYSDLRSYVLDQFMVGDYFVTCVEDFTPQGDPSVWLSFAVHDQGRVIMALTVESSLALKDQGFACVLVIQSAEGRVNTGIHYRELPSYPVIRQEVRSILERTLGVIAEAV